MKDTLQVSLRQRVSMAQRHTSTFRLVRLEREELIRQCKSDDYEVWGAPDMTKIDYQAEESVQRMTAHAKQGLIVWALVERSPLDEDGNAFGSESDMLDNDLVPGVTPIVCHCESYKFDCIFRKLHGDMVAGSSYHINAVFTLPAYRNRGLAKFLVQQVSRYLSRHADAVASVLYSDIGRSFYEQLGWKAHQSTSAIVDVGVYLQQSKAQHSATPRHLYLDDHLDELLSKERNRLENDLRADAIVDQEVFAVVPTRTCLEWQFSSGVFHSRLRQPHQSPPERCGVLISHEAFALWTHDFRSSTLYVTYVSSCGRDAVRELLAPAINEAHQMGLKQITIWDPPEQLRQGVPGCTIVERESSLSSLMVFKHHQDDLNRVELPTWLHNERFAWV